MSTRKTPERPRAVLVTLDIGRASKDEDRIEEASRLVKSAGVEVSEVVRGRRDRPDSATFAGSGKVDEIKLALLEHRASIVVFDDQLSASQIRNLERSLSEGGAAVQVYDRTDIILNIFAQRARTNEGKLQVELARLEHLSTRLVRGWTHLERQRGSLGKTGGPGEKQIELDRRMIGEKVKKLKERIKKVGKVRATQRSGRARSGVLRVAIVGYTNAGKSTLFNRLAAKGEAYVADKLFATLDTTTRRVYLGENAQITISDTVGFIRDLPHTLVAAFKATLEESVEADLLLHVVDSANPRYHEQIEDVNQVLEEIGAGELPQLLVYNQIDRSGLAPEVMRDSYGKILNIKVSAATGAGIEALRDVLAEAARDSSRPLQSAA